MLGTSLAIAGGLAGGALAFGNQIGNSALGYYMSKKMMAQQYKYKLKEAREMPSAQVEGLRSANLNPLLAVGGGVGSGGVSSLSGGNLSSDADWLSSAQKGAMLGSAVGVSVKENEQKKKENKILDEKLAQEESLTSAVQSESRTREVQAFLNEIEANAQIGALTGQLPIVEVSGSGKSIYKTQQFQDYLKKLTNQIEYDSYKRNRAHAIWEDTINAIHGINEGASAYEHAQGARKTYNNTYHFHAGSKKGK